MNGFPGMAMLCIAVFSIVKKLRLELNLRLNKYLAIMEFSEKSSANSTAQLQAK